MSSKVSVKEFNQLHDNLLNCYSQVFPASYIHLQPEEQKAFCLNERRQLENVYFKDQISISDFFNAKVSK